MKSVVGAAILRDGCVLAARRTSPPEAAGRWEFPGGKVEPGESPTAALVREIVEELGCTIDVRRWLDGVAPIGGTHELTVATAVITKGEPIATEHDALRWLTPEELDDVDWLEPDRPFLAELREILFDRDTGVVRGIFFEEDDAQAVVAQLLREGWEASVQRERLAGEDDDEDHPWAVLTDAPDIVFEVLVDQHDGWLDAEESAPDPVVVVPPLDLPTGPKRIKRPTEPGT